MSEHWEPGDALHRRGTWSNYIYNFRPSDDEKSEVYSCPDAATWPEPSLPYVLTDRDELGELIEAVRGQGAA